MNIPPRQYMRNRLEEGVYLKDLNHAEYQMARKLADIYTIDATYKLGDRANTLHYKAAQRPMNEHEDLMSWSDDAISMNRYVAEWTKNHDIATPTFWDKLNNWCAKQCRRLGL